MATKKAPVQQGRLWTAKDLATIRRCVKAGMSGTQIAKELGRTVSALYQRASIEGISLARKKAAKPKAAPAKAKPAVKAKPKAVAKPAKAAAKPAKAAAKPAKAAAKKPAKPAKKSAKGKK